MLLARRQDKSQTQILIRSAVVTHGRNGDSSKRQVGHRVLEVLADKADEILKLLNIVPELSTRIIDLETGLTHFRISTLDDMAQKFEKKYKSTKISDSLRSSSSRKGSGRGRKGGGRGKGKGKGKGRGRSKGKGNGKGAGLKPVQNYKQISMM